MATVGLGWVKVKMLPFDNKSEFQIILNMPEGSSLEQTTAVAREMAAAVRVEPEVTDYQVYAGVASPYNFNGLVRHYFMRGGANVADIQSQRHVSDDMSIYVRNSCVTDPHVAPAGQSGLYILVPTINTRHGFDWENHKEEYADKILRRIEERTSMKDLRSHIVTQRIISPADWESSSIFMGATFNLAHTLGQMLYMRPHNRYKGFNNCYLVGGGTHPGSGLPVIFESARISARLLLEDLGQAA